MNKSAITVCVLLLGVLPETRLSAEAIQVQRGVRQLFLDDYVIDQIDGLRRVVNPATKHPNNPVLQREHPWEQFRAMIYGSALYDEEEKLFKMWYTCMPHNNTQPAVQINGKNRVPWVTLIAYATSKDGIRWSKRNLNQLDFNGISENNLVDVGRDNVEGFAVLKDTGHLGADPLRRYQAFFWEHRSFRGDQYKVPPYQDPPEGNWGQGMWLAYSPDGIHWNNHGRVIDTGSDTHQTLVYDPRLNRYVCFNRIGAGGRNIARLESPDLLSWGKPQRVFQADERDPPGTQVYGMSVIIYEGVYIGLPWMFYTDGVIDVELAYSRDGKSWQRTEERVKVIPAGKEGSWDGADLRMGNSIIVKDDTIYLYYSAARGGHPTGNIVGKIDKYTHEYHQKYRSMHVGLATLRRDGWVSLNGDEEGGSATTKTMTVPDGNLFVNADARQGKVVVEARDAAGRVVATARPVEGDQLRARVEFDGEPPSAGSQVRLTFRVQDARLYSFWWK